MGSRRIRRDQRRDDMADSRRRNGMRKAKERARRDYRMLDLLRRSKWPCHPAVMSWLSSRLKKPARDISQADVDEFLKAHPMTLEANTWYVRLQGSSDRIERYGSVASRAGVKVTKFDGTYYLTCDSVRSAPGAQEALERGLRCLRLLHGAYATIHGRPLDVTAHAAARVSAVGQSEQHNFIAETIQSPDEAITMTITYRDGREEVRDVLGDSAQPLLEAAMRFPAVQEALSLVADPNPDYRALYKVYEIIRDDCGGDLDSKGYVSKGTLNDLTLNMNHPGLSGDDARHARMKGTPSPSKAMSREEVRGRIGELMQAWAKDKLSQP